MRKLIAFAALIALSIALYLTVFSVVHRPLVIGEIQKNLDYKLDYARTLPSPKIVIFAGSNGRYSHRCEEFTRALGLPCVNASIGVGIGIDFLLDQWTPFLKRGDLVYMPLEYSQYRFSNAEMHGGLQNALMVHHQQDYLWSLDMNRIIAAYGSFDMTALIHGLVEMGLDRTGFHRRSSTESLTPQGDEQGHTASAAAPYQEFLQSRSPDSSQVPADSDAIRVIASFLAEAGARGVIVVGGLPTVPESAVVRDTDIRRLKLLFEERGQRFLTLENHSQYPTGCFFDTLYHLNEDCQRAHSVAVAARWSALLDVAGSAL